MSTGLPDNVGDVNCDGTVDANDALSILSDTAAITIESGCSAARDVNCDGAVDARDVLFVLAYVGGLPQAQSSNCGFIGPDPMSVSTVQRLAGQLTVVHQTPSQVAAIGTFISSGPDSVSFSELPASLDTEVPHFTQDNPALGTNGGQVVAKLNANTQILISGGINSLKLGDRILVGGQLSDGSFSAQLIERVPDSIQSAASPLNAMAPNSESKPQAETNVNAPIQIMSSALGDDSISPAAPCQQPLSCAETPTQFINFDGSTLLPGTNYTSPYFPLGSFSTLGCTSTISAQIQLIATLGARWEWPMKLDVANSTPFTVGSPGRLTLSWTPLPLDALSGESFSIGAGLAIGMNFAVGACNASWQIGGPSLGEALTNQVNAPAPVVGQTQVVPSTSCPGIGVQVPWTNIGLSLQLCETTSLTGAPLTLNASAPGYAGGQESLNGTVPLQLDGTPQSSQFELAVDHLGYAPTLTGAFNAAIAVGAQTISTTPPIQFAHWPIHLGSASPSSLRYTIPWNQGSTATPAPTPTSTPPVGAPSAPTLLNPANGTSHLQSQDVTLSWNTPGVQSYTELWGGPYSLLSFGGWTARISLHIGQMWPGTYSWHVKSRNAAGGESGWSSTWTFTIASQLPTPLPVPRQISPPDGAIFSNYPRWTHLEWAPVDRAVYYVVEVEFQYDGVWSTVYGLPNIYATGYTFNFVGAQPGRWRVWAVDAASQEGAKSPWRQFTYTI